MVALFLAHDTTILRTALSTNMLSCAIPGADGFKVLHELRPGYLQLTLHIICTYPIHLDRKCIPWDPSTKDVGSRVKEEDIFVMVSALLNIIPLQITLGLALLPFHEAMKIWLCAQV